MHAFPTSDWHHSRKRTGSRSLSNSAMILDAEFAAQQVQRISNVRERAAAEIALLSLGHRNTSRPLCYESLILPRTSGTAKTTVAGSVGHACANCCVQHRLVVMS